MRFEIRALAVVLTLISLAAFSTTGMGLAGRVSESPGGVDVIGPQPQVPPVPTITPLSSYTVRAPIQILGNQDFNAANGVVAGSGTELDPYVIEGWSISTAEGTGIAISDTQAHFLIRHVLVRDSLVGISLVRVSHGSLIDASVVQSVWPSGPSRMGVLIEASSGILIRWSTVSWYHHRGLLIQGSDRVTVAESLFTKNIDVGLEAFGSTNVTLRENLILENLYGSFTAQGSSGLRLVRNTISGAPQALGRAFGGDHVVIEENFIEAPLRFGNVGTVVIVNNSFKGFGNYISLEGTPAARVESNAFSGYSVIVLSSPNSLVRKNVFRAGSIGINSADGSRFLDNWLTAGSIHLFESSDTTVRGNVILGGEAVRVYRSGRVSIESNVIVGTTAGIEAFWYCAGTDCTGTNDLRILSNHIASAGKGIAATGATGLIVYHNNLVRNTRQASDESGLGNAWDGGYPTGGNYWSDYSGWDSCAGPNQDDCSATDGIGDFAYIIGPSSRDRYPLMRIRPVSPVARINVTSDSALAGGQAVSFDASGSFDPDGGAIVSHEWDFGDGSVAAIPTVDHHYTISGMLRVTLTVRDDEGSTSSSFWLLSVGMPGVLRITTSIDIHPESGVLGRILVDDIPRDEWGLAWMKIAPGAHKVSFSDVPGLGTPAEVIPFIAPGSVVEVRGVYRAHGWIRVVTDPPVPATIFLDGVPSNDWGVWMAVPPGTYRVGFGPTQGYMPPNPQTVSVTVEAEMLTVVTGAYAYDGVSSGPDSSTYGLLRFTTRLSDGTLGVPSQIIIDGIPRDEWGLTWLKLPPGRHYFHLSDVPGLTTPWGENPFRLVVPFDIIAGAVKTIDATFQIHGWLRVVTEPAVSSTIFLDGIPVNDWGIWRSVKPGTHVVSFGGVPGFLAPPPQAVVVEPGLTTVVRGAFEVAGASSLGGGPRGH